ncbi:MAG: 5-oxoprolinase subunit PxpB [Sphingobacteriales bacterium]|nr:MAG: 5-oxoprolinase subunit PxpB [Sphingobacteriales bacterium]
MQASPPYHIQPLGDSAISISFGNRIDRQLNERVMTMFRYLRKHLPGGVTDIVPAYSSLTLHYDYRYWQKEMANGMSVFEVLKQDLESLFESALTTEHSVSNLVKIPVCYEGRHAPDLSIVASMAGLRPAEVIAQHTEKSYHVYMLGFLPGFAYMGEVAETIAMPRKDRPQPTVAGSVGIAGLQTGVYPLDSPGGWHIIGRTPLAMFDADSGQSRLQPGDQVQFYPISSHEFIHY